MLGYCAQLFREGSGQDAVRNASTLGTLEKALRVRLAAPLTVSDLLDVVPSLPCDELLLVSLRHTAKHQHALSLLTRIAILLAVCH